MNERMDERYGLDTPQEREREDMELRAKYEALEKRDERMADLVHYARHYLHDENLIDDEEFAALVTDAGQSVARLEGYDKLRKENAALKQQVADGDLAFNHANEVVAALEAQVARLSWQPITPENLPKVGDEVMRTRVGLSGESYTTTESVVFSDTTFDEYMAVHCTHFRPINPSLIASRTTPAKGQPCPKCGGIEKVQAGDMTIHECDRCYHCWDATMPAKEKQ